MRVNGELSESYNVEVDARQGCVMSPWLFNIYMDGCIREMKVGVQDLGARLTVSRWYGATRYEIVRTT